MSSLNLETRLNYKTAPTEVPSEIALLASLKATSQPQTDKPRNPIDLSIVLDRSGSMQGEKLALCQKTLEFLVDVLSEKDFLSIITFDTTVAIDYAGGKMTHENKQQVLQTISRIRAGSSTNLSDGLYTGIENLKERGTAEVSAICLLTDGLMNHGLTDPQRVLERALGQIESFPEGRAKPSIFTFGYGNDADSTILNLLSTKTGGQYYPIENIEAVPLAFADVIGGLMSVAAQNIEIICEVNGGGADFNGDPITKFPFEKLSSTLYKLKIKDMYCEERRDVLFKVRLPAFKTEDPTIVKVTCKYVDAINEKSDSLISTNQIDRVKGDKLPSDPDVEVERHVIRVDAARSLEEARLQCERSDYDGGRARVAEVINLTKVKMEKYNIKVEQDAMLSELCTDLQMAQSAMKSSDVFNRGGGKSKMAQAAQSHWNQRSNKTDSMMDEGAEETSAYANSAKKEMMKMSKARFHG